MCFSPARLLCAPFVSEPAEPAGETKKQNKVTSQFLGQLVAEIASGIIWNRSKSKQDNKRVMQTHKSIL